MDHSSFPLFVTWSGLTAGTMPPGTETKLDHIYGTVIKSPSSADAPLARTPRTCTLSETMSETSGGIADHAITSVFRVGCPARLSRTTSHREREVDRGLELGITCAVLTAFVIPLPVVPLLDTIISSAAASAVLRSYARCWSSRCWCWSGRLRLRSKEAPNPPLRQSRPLALAFQRTTGRALLGFRIPIERVGVFLAIRPVRRELQFALRTRPRRGRFYVTPFCLLAALLSAAMRSELRSRHDHTEVGSLTRDRARVAIGNDIELISCQPRHPAGARRPVLAVLVLLGHRAVCATRSLAAENEAE